MKVLLALIPMTVLLSHAAYAYPEDQLKACISSAIENPNMKDADRASIEGFCDCALRRIMDKGKSQERSAKRCARYNFNNN